MGRFAHLVDTPMGMEGFRALYQIPRGISLQYCSPGEWINLRSEQKVVIPMIAFIKEGMRLPRDYLIAHKLSPHQWLLTYLEFWVV